MWTDQWIDWFWLAATIAGLAAGGYLLMKLFRYEVRQLVRRAVKKPVLDATLVQWIEEISRGIRMAVIAVVAILMLFFTLRALGHPAVAGWRPVAILSWLLDRGVRIVILLAGAYVAIKVAHILISKLTALIRPHDNSPVAEIERQKRANTVAAILKNFSTAVIAVVTSLMVMAEIGINTTPILTSLGVVGVALGFGAQQLVGDLIAGFFNIFENQIRVGDVAVINGVAGQVEEIRLRTTVLRGGDGTVHVFRNGTINTLANMTKDYSYFALDLAVAYKEDTDRVSTLAREVAEELRADPEYRSWILEPVEVLGIESFSDSAVVIKLRIKTVPIKQWEVGREFRRRIKYRFEKEGIELPSPALVVTPGKQPNRSS
ncbi:MAG: mechanosensitive ion channel family protein [Acidobacteria bacterium]|nr:mechanosensitive ion channel family protein [Acidobacteriota bacterium]